MTARIGSGVAAGTTAPLAETVIATLTPGLADPTVQVLCRADCVLTGTASTTSMTLQIRRGVTTAGVSLASVTVPLAGAVSDAASLAIPPDPGGTYDGTGYCLTVQAAGAAGTCGPGMLETEASYVLAGF